VIFHALEGLEYTHQAENQGKKTPFHLFLKSNS